MVSSRSGEGQVKVWSRSGEEWMVLYVTNEMEFVIFFSKSIPIAVGIKLQNLEMRQKQMRLIGKERAIYAWYDLESIFEIYPF